MADFDKEKLEKLLSSIGDKLTDMGLTVLPAQQIAWDPQDDKIVLFLPLEISGPAMNRLVDDEDMNRQFKEMMAEQNRMAIQEKKDSAIEDARKLLEGGSIDDILAEDTDEDA